MKTKIKSYKQFISSAKHRSDAFKFPMPSKAKSKPISAKIIKKIFKWIKKKIKQGSR